MSSSHVSEAEKSIKFALADGRLSKTDADIMREFLADARAVNGISEDGGWRVQWIGTTNRGTDPLGGSENHLKVSRHRRSQRGPTGAWHRRSPHRSSGADYLPRMDCGWPIPPVGRLGARADPAGGGAGMRPNLSKRVTSDDCKGCGRCCEVFEI